MRSYESIALLTRNAALEQSYAQSGSARGHEQYSACIERARRRGRGELKGWEGQILIVTVDLSSSCHIVDALQGLVPETRSQFSDSLHPQACARRQT